MSAAHLESILNRLAQVTGHPPQRSGDEWRACCPVHEADGRSHTPSLSVRKGDRQEMLINCHAGCDYGEIIIALGLEGKPDKPAARRIVAAYSYCDEAGKEVRQKVRYEPKGFTIRHQDAAGQWVYKAGAGPAVLYRLPEVLAGIAEGQTIFLVEGEKDVDRLRSMGLIATTNIEGASEPGKKAKWRKEYTQQLTGASRVVLIPDNDAPGRAHLQHIAQQLHGNVGDLRWLELPGLPEKGDVSDWFNQEHTREEFLALVEQAPVAGQQEADAPVKKGNSRAHEKVLIKPTESSGSAESISYSFPTRQQPVMDALSTRHPPFIVQVPDLETIDAKGRRVAVIDSFAAQSLANALAGRLAFCREAMIWHGFTGTHWQPFPTAALAEDLVAKLFHAGTPRCGFKANHLNGVISLLRRGLLPLPEISTVGGIPFTNGIFNPATQTLIPITPSNALTWCLPYSYTPDADCPTVKAWLQQAVGGDMETLEFLRAWLTALLTGRADLQKFLHLFGPGGTGKGTFIRLATALVGDNNAIVTDLRSLEQNRFETAALYGKRLASITDTSRYGGSVDVLKAMTGQDQLRLERKHQQQGATFVFAGLVLLASNEAIQTTDHTSAIERRRLTVRFEHIASNEERRLWDQQGGEAAVLHREIPGVVNWCLQLSRDDVTRLITHRSAQIDEANLEALQASNPIAGWLMDNTIPAAGYKTQIGDKQALGEGLLGFKHADEWLYPNYLTWCQRQGREALSLTRFPGLVLDMAYMLKIDVRKKREETGRFLIGLRLRNESEAPFIWSMSGQPVIECRVSSIQPIDSAEPDDSVGFSTSYIYARGDTKADLDALVHHLKNGYKGCDTAELRTLFGDDEDRWQTAVDAALDLGLIRVAGGFWYAEEVRS